MHSGRSWLLLVAALACFVTVMLALCQIDSMAAAYGTGGRVFRVPSATSVAAPSAQLRLAAPQAFDAVQEGKDAEELKDSSTKQNVNRIIVQLFFGVLFYCIVASKYPKVSAPNERSVGIMNESVCFRCPCSQACLLSLFCPAAMMGHIMHSSEVLNYWVGLIASALCPCITVFYAHTCSEVNTKLGGERKGCFMGCLEAMLCSCCVILKMSDATDAATGTTVGCCSVNVAGREVDYQPMPVDKA